MCKTHAGAYVRGLTEKTLHSQKHAGIYEHTLEFAKETLDFLRNTLGLTKQLDFFLSPTRPATSRWSSAGYLTDKKQSERQNKCKGS